MIVQPDAAALVTAPGGADALTVELHEHTFVERQRAKNIRSVVLLLAVLLGGGQVVGHGQGSSSLRFDQCQPQAIAPPASWPPEPPRARGRRVSGTRQLPRVAEPDVLASHRDSR